MKKTATRMLQVSVPVPLDQVKTWNGRTAAVGAFTAEEWQDLFTILSGLDGFVDTVAVGLDNIERTAILPLGLSAQLVTLRDLARSAQKLTPALSVLMGRFALIQDGGRLQ